ncbi:hypothetical protein J1614_001604 [Plenodomus biglobosus]|nr:hypothetical protein J1614_001604 [Plenodomus biglobosus]
MGREERKEREIKRRDEKSHTRFKQAGPNQQQKQGLSIAHCPAFKRLSTGNGRGLRLWNPAHAVHRPITAIPCTLTLQNNKRRL